MREEIGERTISSDEPDYDRHWLSCLFEVGEGGGQPFCVEGVLRISEIKVACLERGSFEQMRADARKNIGRIHRADADVAILIKIYDQAKLFLPN